MTAPPWRQCADCAHQVRRPATSVAGMHGCAALGGYRFALEQRVCADWLPVNGGAEADDAVVDALAPCGR